ncbi:MAG: class I SAM-dependent methyltransferase [Solirubrobacteraceae bacterium]
MRYLTEAWIGAARLRRKAGKPTVEEWHERRRRWVAEHAPGKSFADIGGLFIDGRVAFEAEEAGATATTLFDAGDREYAPTYLAEHEQRGSSVRYVQGDLHDDVSIEQIGPHDVVWCTGVLYHTPSPVHQLTQLRKITKELLYLGTHTIAEVPGVPQACLYYPYLDGHTRAALTKAHFRADGCLGVGPPIDERPMHGYANFWWGITPSALVAMLRTARFELVEMPRIHGSPFYVDLVARPVDADPMLPPTDYYRRRREARDRGEELPWEDFYERTREP